MSVSGVDVPDDVKDIVDRMIKDDQTYQSAVFYLQAIGEGKDQKFVWTVKNTSPKLEETKKKKQIDREQFAQYYTNFIQENIAGCQEPIYALFDFSGCRGGNLNLVGFQWCPDECNVKKKMVYASSVRPLKDMAKSTYTIESNDKDDVLFDKVFGLKK